MLSILSPVQRAGILEPFKPLRLKAHGTSSIGGASGQHAKAEKGALRLFLLDLLDLLASRITSNPKREHVVVFAVCWGVGPIEDATRTNREQLP